MHGVGEHVGEIRSSVDRAGFVIAQAESAAAAAGIAEKGIEAIRIEVEEA